MVRVGGDLKDHLVPTPLPWAGTPSTRQGCCCWTTISSLPYVSNFFPCSENISLLIFKVLFGREKKNVRF